jgi:CAAX prenyl protease-like protein
MLPYLLPFAIYIGLSLIGNYFENGVYIMYPVKTLCVAASLWYFRQHYDELRIKLTLLPAIAAVVTGIVVFLIWILPEGLYPHLGTSEFDPTIFANRSLLVFLIVFRIAGAVLVVPIFEELFWRSFLIRWIIKPDFKKVPLGTFTWASFLLISLFFGLEHHRWLVGLAAGVIYNLLLYRQKQLLPCVIAHAVTNLALAVYVLFTGRWSYW